MDPHHHRCPQNFIRLKNAEFWGTEPAPCRCPEWWTNPEATR